MSRAISFSLKYLHMVRFRQLLEVYVALLLAILIVNALPVYGHSNLDYTDPPLGSRLQESPDQFEFFFTEEIDPEFGYFRVLNDVDEILLEFEAVFEDENKHVLLVFETTLDNGVYYIGWEIMSSVDGHVTRGLVPFSVGIETGGIEFHDDHATSSEVPLNRVVVRWISYLSMLILIGSIFFPLLLHKARELDVPDTTYWSRLVWIALGTFILAETLDLYMQSLEVNAPFLQVATESQWGYARLGKISMAFAIGIFLFRKPYDPIRLGASAAVAGIMIATHATASHNYGLIGFEGLIADIAHLSAAALWLGGLIQLALIWVPGFKRLSIDDRVEIHANVISRFSQMALISVLLLLASGIYVAPVHIPSWDALFQSVYGQALIIKILLIIPVIVIAALNRFKFVPAIKASGSSAVHMLKRFRVLISSEALILIVVLFFAAIMTNVAPPHDHGLHAAERAIELSQVLEDARIDLVIQPLIDGERIIGIQALDADGVQLERILRIWLEFEYQSVDLGGTEINATAEPAEEMGAYQISGPYLNLDGDWDITVHVRIGGRASDIVTTFEVNTITGVQETKGGSGN